MPFTLSHPVLVLPLYVLLRRLQWSALAIGAMIPDITYFIALRPTGTLGHTLHGALTHIGWDSMTHATGWVGGFGRLCTGLDASNATN